MKFPYIKKELKKIKSRLPYGGVDWNNLTYYNNCWRILRRLPYGGVDWNTLMVWIWYQFITGRLPYGGVDWNFFDIFTNYSKLYTSPPIRRRGLKFPYIKKELKKIKSRLPYGGVDWNNLTYYNNCWRILRRLPYGGVDWNTLMVWIWYQFITGRLPYGGVDWNINHFKAFIFHHKVASHTEAWIEIILKPDYEKWCTMSPPIRRRGLK